MKLRLWKIICSTLLFLTSLLFLHSFTVLKFTGFLAAYLIVSYDILKKAIKNVIHGNVFNENFLMSIASIGAFCIGEYPEGVAVMLFYQVGEFFQSRAINSSRSSIADLMDIRPDSATVLHNKEYISVHPDDVSIGDTILIKPGEKIPLDAVVIEGSSNIDMSALSGESVPHKIHIGDEIMSGSINLTGVITAKVIKVFGESTASKILELVENASTKKSNQEKFITKFARYYTPVVIIAAALLAIVPPLLSPYVTFKEQIYRALSFLVVSCPCALVISVPLGFFGGIGRAARFGILIKGSNYLDALSHAEIMVFDKTGTLTEGIFEVQEINSCGISKQELLELAAYSEYYSNHPISQSVKHAYDKEIDTMRISETDEISGYGVSATIDGRNVLAGNKKLMDRYGIDCSTPSVAGTIIHVAVDNKYTGYLVISDKIKRDSKKAISDLNEAGIRKTVMLTGDSDQIAHIVAEELGIDEFHSYLLPTDKVIIAENLICQTSKHGSLVFAGDGINDAPVLARADIGISMGVLGSDAAIEAADIVIMSDEPSKIAVAINLSKYTLKIVKQNIVFILFVKALILLLSSIGLASMWGAVFADVGVSILAILNSMRILRLNLNEKIYS